MNEYRFDRSIQSLARASGRRDAVRALGASGLALLAALRLADATARESHKGGVQVDGKGKKKRKSKRGPTGPAGPAGPAGVASNPDRSVCVASLLRTTDVGSTVGAHIQATAVCLD
jgi:hypothetical protein